MLAKQYRLKRRSDFNFVYKRGSHTSSKYFVLLFAKNRTNSPRIGFVVSKKVGNAVVRNKIKRKMRASLLPIIKNISPQYNFIFIARGGEEISVSELSKTMYSVLEKNNLIV